jgi:hypothetical protein
VLNGISLNDTLTSFPLPSKGEEVKSRASQATRCTDTKCSITTPVNMKLYESLAELVYLRSIN